MLVAVMKVIREHNGGRSNERRDESVYKKRVIGEPYLDRAHLSCIVRPIFATR